MGSAVTTHSPLLLETVARSTPMVALATTTSAAATTAPEVSRTVPVKVAVSCAKAAPAATTNKAIRQQAWRREFMNVSRSRKVCARNLRARNANTRNCWNSAMDGGGRHSTAGRLGWTGLLGNNYPG